MLRVVLTQVMEVEAQHVGAILEQAAAIDAAPCVGGSTPLAGALASLFLRPHLSTSARFPLERCVAEETTGLSRPMVRSTGVVRYRRAVQPEEVRVVELSYVIAVPDTEEPGIRERARLRHGSEQGWRLADIVDDVVSEDYETFSPGVNIVHYSFDLSDETFVGLAPLDYTVEDSAP